MCYTLDLYKFMFYDIFVENNENNEDKNYIQNKLNEIQIIDRQPLKETINNKEIINNKETTNNNKETINYKNKLEQILNFIYYFDDSSNVILGISFDNKKRIN
jgi:hypothetical protein